MSASVTVFSNIPKLTACLRNALPNLHFREVSPAAVPLTSFFGNPIEASEDVLKVLQESSIIVADYNVLASYIYKLPRTKWVQGTWAGADPIIKVYDPARPLPFVVTRFSGPFFGMQMSEYVVASIANREYGFMAFHESQKKKYWHKEEWFPARRCIFDLTIGVLGTGTIGKDIARVLKTLGATVWGVGRSPLTEGQKIPNVDEYRLLSDLPEVLRNCDYVVNVLPGTPETVGVLGGDILKHCAAKRSVLINIGRGSLVSEADLLRALKEGWLAGAVLDVFPIEPLPKESPLWSMPEVTISPHVAGVTRPQDVATLFKENYARYVAGEPLSFELDLTKGY